MTLITPPAFLQAGTYSALLDRMHLVTARTLRDVAFAHRSMGGFFPDRFPSYSNPSGMNWTVTACSGVIANSFALDAGEYAFSNPSNVSGAFAASSPTLNRNDILGFQVKDNFYDASGLNSVIPLVLQGANSAGAPSDPTIPSGFIPVVRAVINAAATTPILQDLRVRTTISGGILPIDAVAARTALGTQYAGMGVYRTDRKWPEYADGSGAWRIHTAVIANDAADLNAIVTSPYEGQWAYRLDTGRYYRYKGSWLPVAGYCHVYQLNGATQNVLNNTQTALTFTGEIRDDFNGHDTVTNPSRYTPPVPGTYKCTGMVSYIGGVAGLFQCQFRKNGAVVVGAAPYNSKNAANQAFLANTTISHGTFDMNGTTDFIELFTIHQFGGTTATFSNTTDQHSYMIIERLP